jgi:hypothetical protein
MTEPEQTTNSYPFVKNFLRSGTFLKRIEEIRKFHPRIEYIENQPDKTPLIEHIGEFKSKNYLNLSRNKKYAVLVEDLKATSKYTQIVDVFQEHVIIRAHYNGLKSLEEVFGEAFEKGDDNVMHQIDPTPKQMIQQRQTLYSLTKPISRFRPTLMIIFIKLFRPRYILDFCAGWGDRLLGALMYCDKIKYYCGIDPNKELFNGYQNMINTLIPEKKDRKKYDMIHGCGEDPTIIPKSPAKNGLYDMIITSPPYYDHEIYQTKLSETNSKQSQSIDRYTSLDDWYDGFLIPSTLNALKSLDIGGYLVISINDTATHSYVTKYFDDITKLASMRYIELFYNVNSGWFDVYKTKCATQPQDNRLTGCQPIFVWQKIC